MTSCLAVTLSLAVVGSQPTAQVVLRPGMRSSIRQEGKPHAPVAHRESIRPRFLCEPMSCNVPSADLSRLVTRDHNRARTIGDWRASACSIPNIDSSAGPGDHPPRAVNICATAGRLRHGAARSGASVLPFQGLSGERAGSQLPPSHGASVSAALHWASAASTNRWLTDQAHPRAFARGTARRSTGWHMPRRPAQRTVTRFRGTPRAGTPNRGARAGPSRRRPSTGITDSGLPRPCDPTTTAC